jgi:hypothetical protein
MLVLVSHYCCLWLPLVWSRHLSMSKWSGQLTLNATRDEAAYRTFKIDHITAMYALCVLCRVAPHLHDFPPCRELADRACFATYDETQHRDDAP